VHISYPTLNGWAWTRVNWCCIGYVTTTTIPPWPTPSISHVILASNHWTLSIRPHSNAAKGWPTQSTSARFAVSPTPERTEENGNHRYVGCSWPGRRAEPL
jgi:hypothetical protein